MCLIKFKNTVFAYGLMFVFFGMMFPGNVASEPPNCPSIEDIGGNEAQWLDRTFSYNPDTSDYVDCYEFIVGSSATQLSVSLRYPITPANAGNDGLILQLFDSQSQSIIKETSIGGGEYNGPQGDETLFLDKAEGEELRSGETYYMQIQWGDETVSNGDPYEIRWNDDDDVSIPEISTPDPAADDTIEPDVSGKQLLQVEVENTDKCYIYYGTNQDDVTEYMEVTPSQGGELCAVDVPYGDNMTNNGTNYWYVEAINNDGGSARLPEGENTYLEFTVSSSSGGVPVVSAPNPADGSSVNAGGSGQLLQVSVTNNPDSCKIYYGTDESNITAFEEVTPSGGSCEVTVPYGDNMTDSGTNYWYVEATNTAGTERYPDTGTLSFTVSKSSILLFIPVIMSSLSGEE